MSKHPSDEKAVETIGRYASWVRWSVRISTGVLLAVCCLATGCRAPREDASTVVVLIESSPNNLDPRQGTDAQSERVGALIFDALVKKDEHANLQPWLATRWEQPDARTWIFPSA